MAYDRPIRKDGAQPAISPSRFDAMLCGPERIWGLEPIAEVLGVSVSTARRWASECDVPIYRPGGTKYFAIRSELVAWLRQK